MNEYEISGIENIARGVCVVGGKVLLCKPKKGGYAYLPGGHIEFGETGRQALVREMQEETGLAAEAGELLGVVESQFEQHGQKHCEISLVYEMTIRDEGSGMRDRVKSCENWIEFEWRDVSDLEGANLLPVDMRNLIPHPSSLIPHDNPRH